jgi:hypothetical protein
VNPERIGTAAVPLHAKMLRDFVACPLRFISSFGSFENDVHIGKTIEELSFGASIVIDFVKPRVAGRKKRDSGIVKRRKERR